MAAASRSNGFYSGQCDDDPTLHPCKAKTVLGDACAWLSHEAEPISIESIISVNNENTRFAVSATPVTQLPDARTLFLCWSEKTYAANTERLATYRFVVDDKVAFQLAAQHKHKPWLRTKLDRDIRHQAIHPGQWRLGEPIPFNLQVWQTAGDPLVLVNGGRQRGPRNNRFRFQVIDGPSTRAIDGADQGGIWGGRKLSATPLTLQEEITRWIAFDTPGRYLIRWHYSGWLCRLSEWGQSHKGWDYVRTGSFVLPLEK